MQEVEHKIGNQNEAIKELMATVNLLYTSDVLTTRLNEAKQVELFQTFLEISGVKDCMDMMTTQMQEIKAGLANRDIIDRSNQSSPTDPASCTSDAPFVTIKYDGEQRHLYVTNRKRDMVLGCRTAREVVRRVLLNFHSIMDLRIFTQTGHSSKTHDTSKQQISPMHVKFVHACVLRLFSVDQRLKEIVNDDGTTMFETKTKEIKAEVRKLIASVLEYYCDIYNEDGKRIVKTDNKRQRSEE